MSTSENGNNPNEKDKNKGDETMSGLAIKCNSPFVSSKKELKRTPMSKENKERRDFIKTHDFCISVDKNTMNVSVSVKDK